MASYEESKRLKLEEKKKLSIKLNKEKEQTSGLAKKEYKGNVTQPNMYKSANNSWRYVSLVFYGHNPGTTGLRVDVSSVYPTDPYSSFYDHPVNIEDVTGGSVFSGTTTSNTSQNGRQLQYNPLNLPSPLTGYRDYKITFDSGHEETLSLFVSFDINRIVYLPNANYYGMGNRTLSCDSNYYPEVGYLAGYGDYSNPVTIESFQTAFTRGISDPIGSFANYAYTRNESSSEIPFRSTSNALGAAQNATTNLVNGPFLSVPTGGIGQGSAFKQIFEIISITTLDINSTAGALYTSVTDKIATNAFTPDWQAVINLIHSDLSMGFFPNVFYAENIPDCNISGTPINACNDPNNMSYWGYDTDSDGILEDCSGVEIPSAIQADPTLALFTSSPIDCCADCLVKNINSLDPFSISAFGVNPTTIGGTDGYIHVSVLNQGFNGNGVPAGLPTGVSSFTYVIQNQDALDTMCGNTAGLGVGSGAVASSSFTFGNSVPANSNGGLLQTGATGTATYAGSSVQGYVPGGTSTSAPYGLGTTNSEGFRNGTYKIYAFDGNSGTCLAQTTVTLTNPAPTYGCLDNAALNYDSSANTAQNSLCEYCEATNGELVDSSGNIIANITSGSSLATIQPTNTTATNSQIQITGLSPTSDFQAYINNIVDGSNVQNADYIIELYKWDNQTSTGNTAFGTLSGFNANTTIVGSAINNQGNGWNVNLDSSTLGAGFTYGYYSIKVSISDPDAAVNIEACYELLTVWVPVGVCIDSGVPVAIDFVVVTDPNLYSVDASICNITNNFCCEIPIFEETILSSTCDPLYNSTFTCDPVADSIVYQLEYYDLGSWVLVGSQVTVTSPSSPYTTPVILNSTISVGAGDYRVSIVSSYSNAPDCPIYSNIITFTPPVFGCTDASALNYDPTALCPAACIYCVYGCMDITAMNYNAAATCDDGTCTYCVYGCTDVTAANYDPAATCDDSSCVPFPCGCTDPTAYNYGYDMFGTLIGYPPTCDDGSCGYCDPLPISSTVTTTAANIISGCISNNDGSISYSGIAGGAAPSCSTYTLVSVIRGAQNYFTTPTVVAYGAVTIIPNLLGGIYTITVKDCNECEMVEVVQVFTNSAVCGCTDPSSDNYNPTATVEDGSCIYCGCMDINATNYNPNATFECISGVNSCIYAAIPPPCIPSVLPNIVNRMQTCISENGTQYYNKLVTGRIDDCSIMNIWKVILINYLLSRIGLECIYNCSDGNTPDPSEVYLTCKQIWVKGGVTTGLNDSAVNTLVPAVGTTAIKVWFDLGSTYTLVSGDIVKHHLSGNIWIFVGPLPITTTPVNLEGIDPETATGYSTGYWKYCNDAMRYTSNSNTINYLDNFINFANTFCRDCGNNF